MVPGVRAAQRLPWLLLLLLPLLGAPSALPVLRWRGGANSGDYAFSLTSFNPEGRLEQLDHAFQAVARAPPVLALCGDHCVVLAAVMPTDRYGLARSATTKVPALTTAGTVGTFSGLAADGRVLLQRVQAAALQYEATLASSMPPARLAAVIAETLQEATQQGGTRPFGCTILLGGLGADGTPQLMQIDPAGNVAFAKATAIGWGADGLISQVSERWSPDLTAENVQTLARDLLLEALRSTPAKATDWAASSEIHIAVVDFAATHKERRSSSAGSGAAAPLGRDTLPGEPWRLSTRTFAVGHSPTQQENSEDGGDKEET
uniref:Proteasome endopeptidase complex n=1 Tax=Rhizochromulina marina TaxID=1034831 RepID=A0A7S2WTP2_9STRA|mmetsp:Transcript_4678/g.13870  ORF Transcript_4678/g.13870 Transcript_4678/m.13870 type:complete len:319 (+) Transcript_4678:121-1077(+)